MILQDLVEKADDWGFKRKRVEKVNCLLNVKRKTSGKWSLHGAD